MLGSRIKERRKELNLTLEDVAQKMGVASSTVLRYETNYIKNMSIDKIEPLANALQCEPAYLLGWIDINRKLTIREKRLLYKFNMLDEIGQKTAINIINELLKVHAKRKD